MAARSIINAIEAYEGESTDGGLLQTERARALGYYLGDPLPNDGGIPEGRSKVVSRDVCDSIEWVKPGLLRIFTSGDEVVSFIPTGQEDIEGAQQETDFVNYIITQKNNWFSTAYQWFTDALIQKNGYVKAWYDTSQQEVIEEYQGKTDDEVAFLVKDEEVEILDLQPYPNPFVQMGQMGPAAPVPPPLFNVKLRKKKEYGCAKYAPIPPERTIIDNGHADVDLWDCNFVEHWEFKTVSALRDEGHDVPDDIGDETGSQEDGIEAQARNRYAQDVNQDEDNPDPSMRKVKVRECWIRFDSDDDGKAELHHVIIVGKTILEDEEVDIIPVACVTPRIMPHRHIGISEADVTIDIQNIKSALQRGLLDNVYFAVNGRHGVDKEKVNLDDMMTSRPAGIVRTDGPPANSIMPLVHQANFQPVLASLEYFDAVREGRTGSSKSAQQISPDALSKIPSGIAIAQIQSAQQAIVELIARVFAETGVKSLFRIVHALTAKHAKQPEVVRLRNKWVPVDPRQWKTRSDMTISVGLGSGNREQQAVALERVLGIQGQMMPLGLADKKTVHHTASKLTQALGFKDTEAFWVDPEKAAQMPAAPPPPPDPIKIAEVKVKAYDAETNRMEAQSKARIEGAKVMQSGHQQEHGQLMDRANLAASQKPGDETAAMRQEAGQSAQQTSQALQAVLQSIAEADQRAAQRHEQTLQLLMEMAKPKSRVIERDPKTQRAIRSHEVPTESLQTVQ